MSSVSLQLLILVLVKFDLFVSGDMFIKSLFTNFLFVFFFSFCISFNKFLGSTVSDVEIETGFWTDFDEINDFTR